MASASALYHVHTLLLQNLPRPAAHLHHPPSYPTRRRCFLAVSSSAAVRLPAAAPSGTERRAVAFEAVEGEDDAARWSAPQAELELEEEVEEHGWAGGNDHGHGHGEEHDGGDEPGGYGAGEDEEEGGREAQRRAPRPRELFVCNLPRRCGVDDLLELFGPYGTVLSVEVSRDAETGISRGCGFVTMSSLPEAKTAINALDGFDLDGREMLVKLAAHVVSSRRNPSLSHTPPMKDHIFESPHKIYVGNLAWSVQPQHLREHFTQCGTIVSTRLLTDRKGGMSRVYGFLSFSSAEELEAALQLNNTNFHGRDIIVREAHVKSPHVPSP